MRGRTDAGGSVRPGDKKTTKPHAVRCMKNNCPEQLVGSKNKGNPMQNRWQAKPAFDLRLITGSSPARRPLFVPGCEPVYRRLFVFVNRFHANHVQKNGHFARTEQGSAMQARLGEASFGGAGWGVALKGGPGAAKVNKAANNLFVRGGPFTLPVSSRWPNKMVDEQCRSGTTDLFFLVTDLWFLAFFQV